MAVIVIILHVQTAFIHEWIIIPDQGVHADAAMVLGASIYQDGTPSDALRDRLMVGVALYKQGIVTRILLTGDDGSYHADEIDVMKRFTIDQGIPEQDILTDGHGYRTYESCKRAKEEYHLNDILVVTQRFHMARALFLCNNLGVHARGVASDLQTYIKINFFWIRDLAASIQAWWDIHIHQPESPVPPGLYAQT
jgi:vancomycin permeability regulator SanA